MNFLINFMANAAEVASNTQAPSASAGAQASQSGGIMGALPMFGVILVFILVMYFFSIRPNKKREKALKDKLSKLKKGDKVQTIGGWRGTVYAIKDKVFILKIDENTKIEVVREAIADVIVEAKAENTQKDDLQQSENQKQIEKKEENTKDEKN